MHVSLNVNGRTYSADIEPRLLLVDFLRHSCRLTGTHVGCEQGACGACTVLMDGRPTRSCLTFAVQAAGHQVVTIEGLSPDDGTLTDLQNSMREHHALQCGFCTPGVLVTASSLLQQDRAEVTREDIMEAVGGHFCRCTGYVNIVDAIEETLSKHGSRPGGEVTENE